MPSITELELPPPSPYQDITARRIIVASFWTVLLLGIPFWWNTTTIERLSLPGNEVQSWVQAGVSASLVKEPRWDQHADE